MNQLESGTWQGQVALVATLWRHCIPTTTHGRHIYQNVTHTHTCVHTCMLLHCKRSHLHVMYWKQWRLWASFEHYEGRMTRIRRYSLFSPSHQTLTHHSKHNTDSTWETSNGRYTDILTWTNTVHFWWKYLAFLRNSSGFNSSYIHGNICLCIYSPSAY